jgi:hypothetical protein
MSLGCATEDRFLASMSKVASVALVMERCSWEGLYLVEFVVVVIIEWSGQREMER